METEAKIIIAFLFNRSGKPALTESEVYLPLSMELGWFTTNEAQEFVTYAVAQGFLEKKDGMLQPTFPIETITVPVGFAPRKKTFLKKKKQAKDESMLEAIVSRICEHANRAPPDVHEEIAQVVSEKKIIPEVAALYLARKYTIPCDEWFDTVEAKLLTENTGE
jgi:hypothetical protein